jgi:hypothetical protein
MLTLRERLILWRDGDSAQDEWAAEQLQRGDLELWLDPALPLLSLARPEVYTSNLRSGAVYAGVNLARGAHIYSRELVRGEDDFALLTSTLQTLWDGGTLGLMDVTSAMFPWTEPFTTDEGQLQPDFCDSWEVAAAKADSEQFRTYTQFVFSLQGMLGISNQQMWGLLSSDGSKSIYADLRAWSEDPQAPPWSSVFLQPLRENSYGELTDCTHRYLCDRLGLVAHLAQHSPDPSQAPARVAAELRRRYPTIPLLQYFPTTGTLPYAQYGKVRPPTLFTPRGRP